MISFYDIIIYMKNRLFLIILILPFILSGEMKIGLALGGGSARGLAHIGVLKALEENNIPIDYIGGTSMGAIIGALWASGYSAVEIESIFVKTDIQNWFLETPILERRPINYNLNLYPVFLSLEIKNGKFILPQSIVSDKILNLKMYTHFSEIDNAIQGDFRKLWKPFLCISSDIYSNKLLVFTKGKLTRTVRASMAIPIVFSPIESNNEILFDGGLYNNLPTNIIKDTFETDYVISVDVSSDKKSLKRENLNVINISFSMIDLLTKSVSIDSIKKYGSYIRPDVGKYNGSEFNKVEELIKLGYDAALTVIPKIITDIERREKYTDNRKEMIENYVSFDSCIVNNLEITANNKFQYVIISNAINITPGNRFSFRKLENGIFKLYSMGIFREIEPEIESNDDSTLNLTLKAKAVKKDIVGIGGFYNNTAGVNIYGKYERCNLLDKGGFVSLYGFAGNYLKGVASNLIFPSLIYTNYTASFYYNYLIYKYYSVWSNYYNYHYNSNLDFLIGYNINDKSIISLFMGFKYKKIPDMSLFKTYIGLYLINYNMSILDFNSNGSKINLSISFNFPYIDYSDISADNINLAETYAKVVGDFLRSIRVTDNINIRISSEFSILSELYKNQVLPDNVVADYVFLKPIESFDYLYDRSLTGKYEGGIGIATRYYFNKIVYLQNKNRFYMGSNTIASYSPTYLYGTSLDLGFTNLFGKLQIGLEYIYISRNLYGGHKFYFNISVGNSMDKIDIIDKF